MTNKKVILIDLDGVLNKYTGEYQENYIPEIQDGALLFIKNLSKKYNVKLFTTREKQLVLRWIKEHKIEEYVSDVTNTKEPAWLYIDDRCVKFEGNFDKLTKQIETFKTWYS